MCHSDILRRGAGTIRHDVSQQAYTSYGASVSLASVGMLTTLHSGGSRIATGTLIAPDVILTAAHTLQNANSLNFMVGGLYYTASDWLTHPNWTGNLPAGYDLALVKLSNSVTNVAPATRYRGSAEVGTISTIAGFGKTGTGLTGATTYDGKKRAGTNRVDSTSAGSGSDARLLWIDFDQPTTYSQRTAVTGATTREFMPALGDSGGGMFMSTSQGLELIGVNSFTYGAGSNINSRYGDYAGYVRVSAFNAWIDSVLQSWTAVTPTSALATNNDWSANGLDDATITSNPTAVPEPSSAILALMAIVGLARYARRKL